MSSESSMFITKTDFTIIDMIGACQVKVKCFKMETGLMNYRHDRRMSGEN